MSYDLQVMQLAQQGFCCSQIIMKLALDTEGVENKALIRSMAGLCQGSPSGTGSCGAFTGATCLLAYYAAKGDSYDEEDDRLPLINEQFSQWFNDYCVGQDKSTTCISLMGGELPQPHICGQLIIDCYEMAITILTENGFTYGSPKND